MKKIKLNILAKNAMKKKEMNIVRGGAGNCWCGCRYAGQGGSSTSANGGANNAGDLCSPGDIEECIVLG